MENTASNFDLAIWLGIISVLMTMVSAVIGWLYAGAVKRIDAMETRIEYALKETQDLRLHVAEHSLSKIEAHSAEDRLCTRFDKLEQKLDLKFNLIFDKLDQKQDKAM